METYILIAVALIACISVHFATNRSSSKFTKKSFWIRPHRWLALEQQLAEMKVREESSKKSIEEVKAAMLDSIKSAAADALGQNNKQFLTLAQTQFTAHKSEAETDLETRKKGIEDLLKPVKEAIERKGAAEDAKDTPRITRISRKRPRKISFLCPNPCLTRVLRGTRGKKNTDLPNTSLSLKVFT